MCGITHGGVRWNRCSLPRRGCIAGTTCTAVAPDPSSATRFPVRSSPWSHLAVWNALPSKRSRPGSVGRPWLAEEAGRGHQHACGQRLAGGLELPVLLLGDPGGAKQLAAQAGVAEHVEPAGAVAQVLEDLVAHRVRGLPVVFRRERERVEVGGDVALRARVAVRPPCAAHVGAALEQHEVLDARLLQADRHAEPAEAGADDGHLVHVHVVHPPDATRAVSCPG